MRAQGPHCILLSGNEELPVHVQYRLLACVHCTCLWYPHAALQLPQRMVGMLGAAGLLLALLQPPVPMTGGARCPKLPLSLCPRLWDERHVPLVDAEDVEVWGLGLARKDHWPRWVVCYAMHSTPDLALVDADHGFGDPRL